jgi:hypothetical protein
MFREPLLHFAVLGLGLFLLWGLVGPPDAGLVVTLGTVDRLKADEERRLGRAPTDAEFDAVLQSWIDDELLYREGLALGLDTADPVVRRRVVQKMRFLYEDLRPIAEPTDEQLATFAGAHSVPGQVGFEHVFLRRDLPDLDAVVQRLQGRLEGGGDPAKEGEPFALGRSFTARALPVIERDFGSDFAQALRSAALHTWFRADSPFGAHLVRVTDSIPPRAPTADELRGLALDDWRRQQRRKNAEQALRDLREQRPVQVAP